MKTFTVRDLARSTAKVLAIVRSEGSVRIRGRSGRTFVITSEAECEKPIVALPDFSERRKGLFTGTLSLSIAREFDRALASE